MICHAHMKDMVWDQLSHKQRKAVRNTDDRNTDKKQSHTQMFLVFFIEMCETREGVHMRDAETC